MEHDSIESAAPVNASNAESGSFLSRWWLVIIVAALIGLNGWIYYPFLSARARGSASDPMAGHPPPPPPGEPRPGGPQPPGGGPDRPSNGNPPPPGRGDQSPPEPGSNPRPPERSPASNGGPPERSPAANPGPPRRNDPPSPDPKTPERNDRSPAPARPSQSATPLPAPANQTPPPRPNGSPPPNPAPPSPPNGSPPPPANQTAPSRPNGPPPAPAPGGSRGEPGLGPVDTILGVVLLQAEPNLKLDAQQTQAVLEAARSVRDPLMAAYGGLFEVNRALRPDQIAYLNRNRGGARQDPSRLEKAIELLDKRAAEGGGSLPDANTSSRSTEDLHLSLDEMVGIPLLLEQESSLRLDAAQAAAVKKGLLQMRDIDDLERKIGERVRGVLRPDQLAFLSANRSRLESVRKLVPIWLLARTLEQ